MSQVTDLILVTCIEDGASRDGERPNVDKINEYLINAHPPQRLLQVSQYAGGSKVLGADVFMGGINYLNLEKFLDAFNRIRWEHPESVQLLVKTEDDYSFKLYVPGKV